MRAGNSFRSRRVPRSDGCTKIFWRWNRHLAGDVKDSQIFTAGGKAVETKKAFAKIKDEAVVVITTDGKTVDPNFLRVFKDETLVLVSPEFVGTVRPLPIGPGGTQILPGAVKPPPEPLPVKKVDN